MQIFFYSVQNCQSDANYFENVEYADKFNTFRLAREFHQTFSSFMWNPYVCVESVRITHCWLYLKKNAKSNSSNKTFDSKIKSSTHNQFVYLFVWIGFKFSPQFSLPPSLLHLSVIVLVVIVSHTVCWICCLAVMLCLLSTVNILHIFRCATVNWTFCIAILAMYTQWDFVNISSFGTIHSYTKLIWNYRKM